MNELQYLDETLRRACEGRATSAGGLNIKELKQRLINLFPNERDEIISSKRNELKNSKWCSEVRTKIRDIEKQKYPENNYTEQDKSYCRCVAHVAAKGNVSSPYAVCTSRVGHTQGERVSCTDYYSKEYILPENELVGLAEYKHKDPEKYRQELYPSKY